MWFEKTTTITYNDQGEKAEERTNFTGNSAIPVGVEHSIDEKGRLVPAKSATEPPQARLPVPEQSVIRHVYQYDSYGYWTQQRASGPLTPTGHPPRATASPRTTDSV